VIPLNSDALKILTRRRALAPVFPRWGNLLRDVKLACRKAGIDNVTPNDLRRTFASWLAQSGVSSLVCARLLGHASTRMVEAVYAKIKTDEQHEAVERLCQIRARKRARDAKSASDAK
jgi:integrase